MKPAFAQENVFIYHGDAIEVLGRLPSQSVHCCVTSPPYWGLRNYGVEGQIGLESSLDEFVAKMVEVFRGVWRVLRDDGTLWLNLGDSYADGTRDFNSFRRDRSCVCVPNMPVPPSFKPKNLIGIPWRVAFALQADGWYLRQDVIWHKPNSMPESAKDRCTKAHEYLFLLTKQARYFYDAVAIAETASGTGGGACFGPQTKQGQTRHDESHAHIGGGILVQSRKYDRPKYNTRNRRSVWTVATRSYPGAHFATFPPKLIEPCVKAGTSAGGCCPECGAPWQRITKEEPASHAAA